MSARREGWDDRVYCVTVNGKQKMSDKEEGVPNAANDYVFNCDNASFFRLGLISETNLIFCSFAKLWCRKRLGGSYDPIGYRLFQNSLAEHCHTDIILLTFSS